MGHDAAPIIKLTSLRLLPDSLCRLFTRVVLRAMWVIAVLLKPAFIKVNNVFFTMAFE